MLRWFGHAEKCPERALTRGPFYPRRSLRDTGELLSTSVKENMERLLKILSELAQAFRAWGSPTEM